MGIAALLLFAGRAGADVCAMENLTGEWQPMRQHKDVRLMKSYDVVKLVGNFDLSKPNTFGYADVTMSVYLKNEGPAQTVTIGFPEIVRAKTEDMKPIANLVVTVDGKPAKCTRVKSSGLFYHYWAFKVSFGKGKTPFIRVKYRSMLDKDHKGYAYRNAIQLTSSWKGTVREARLTVDVTKVTGYKSPIVLFPAPAMMKGREIIWIVNNIKPTSVNNMYAAFESKGRAVIPPPTPAPTTSDAAVGSNGSSVP